MIDYLLKFPSKAVAEQFGIANGFAVDNGGVVETTLATHMYAMHVIGEHDGDGQWWLLFRDLVGIPIPDGGEQFIHWSSNFTVDNEDGNRVHIERPISDEVPNIWWA
jgi:hypothetical protein